MEDSVSIPNSSNLEVPEMVQNSKDVVNNKRVQGPPKVEHIQVQLKLLLKRMLNRMLLRTLLNKMVPIKELVKFCIFCL